MTNPPSDYRSMSVDTILDSLAIQIYEPPLVSLRQSLRSIPEVLRIPILVIDFDTEVQMQGILGFLENSTGLYLIDTIDAFETIAAQDTAEILRSIRRIMGDHGVTVERLRTNIADMPEFAISSFRQRHGEEVSQMADPMVQEARRPGGQEARRPGGQEAVHLRRRRARIRFAVGIPRAPQGRACSFVGSILGDSIRTSATAAEPSVIPQAARARTSRDAASTAPPVARNSARATELRPAREHGGPAARVASHARARQAPAD
jgi:Domain of unknown function (DUF4375)